MEGVFLALLRLYIELLFQRRQLELQQGILRESFAIEVLAV